MYLATLRLRIIMYIAVVGCLGTGCDRTPNTDSKGDQNAWQACVKGYDFLAKGSSVDVDFNVLKDPVQLPPNTAMFWHTAGQNVHFINWRRRIYLYKMGDRYAGMLIRGNSMRILSRDMPEYKSFRAGRASYRIVWRKNSVQFSIAYRSEGNGKRVSSCQGFYEDNNLFMEYTCKSVTDPTPDFSIKARRQESGVEYVGLEKPNRAWIWRREGKVSPLTREGCRALPTAPN